MVNDVEMFVASTPAHLLLSNSDSSLMESDSNQLHYVSQLNTVYRIIFHYKNQQFPFDYSFAFSFGNVIH